MFYYNYERNRLEKGKNSTTELGVILAKAAIIPTAAISDL
jgi:hypothetical protein